MKSSVLQKNRIFQKVYQFLVLQFFGALESPGPSDSPNQHIFALHWSAGRAENLYVSQGRTSQLLKNGEWTLIPPGEGGNPYNLAYRGPY